jgi:hypothetical protein
MVAIEVLMTGINETQLVVKYMADPNERGTLLCSGAYRNITDLTNQSRQRGPTYKTERSTPAIKSTVPKPDGVFCRSSGSNSATSKRVSERAGSLAYASGFHQDVESDTTGRPTRVGHVCFLTAGYNRVLQIVLICPLSPPLRFGENQLRT